MERYDYKAAMAADVTRWINDNYDAAEAFERLVGRDTWEKELIDELRPLDSVTGKTYGSYWFSRLKAAEALCHNWDLLAEAMSELNCDCDAIAKGPEWADVTIRCYLLGEAICAALDALELKIFKSLAKKSGRSLRGTKISDL